MLSSTSIYHNRKNLPKYPNPIMMMPSRRRGVKRRLPETDGNNYCRRKMEWRIEFDEYTLAVAKYFTGCPITWDTIHNLVREAKMIFEETYESIMGNGDSPASFRSDIEDIDPMYDNCRALSSKLRLGNENLNTDDKKMLVDAVNGILRSEHYGTKAHIRILQELKDITTKLRVSKFLKSISSDNVNIESNGKI